MLSTTAKARERQKKKDADKQKSEAATKDKAAGGRPSTGYTSSPAGMPSLLFGNCTDVSACFREL